ncbi:MAG: endopeptidase La [Proteobacteria bacterium]|nr:endopeptidase La [Pseudomonadota bacterium]NBP15142.1 endopeptidase La [bacterium]
MKTLLKETTEEMVQELLPVIPTMDVVVFPHMIVPLLVLDERIINGINQSLEGSKKVLLLAAKKKIDDHQGAIGTKDLYDVGTVSSIMRIIKIPEGGVKVLVQGISKARVKEIITDDNILHVSINPIDDYEGTPDSITPHIRNIKEIAEKISASNHSFSPDFHIILSKMNDATKIADFILSHLNLNVEDAQKLLESPTQEDFLEGILNLLNKEVEVAETQERIRSRARDSMNKAQKEFYLREQLKAIKVELGEDDVEEIDKMRKKLDELKLEPEIHEEIKRQISRLDKTAPDSVEATVTRNYIETMLALPWHEETKDNLDLDHAKEVLDEDHYGLEQVKERILDYISIKNLKEDGYAPILCFSGPPGIGKTSLGKSIARALGRKYFRVSLGGVKDESEIRGHRRTYVGSMPGRIIQGMRKTQSKNPVIIIDELDKIGADFRGDPSAAMLEVLDPQQNKTFYDNYLGVPFDLSKVIFIATANNIDAISEPLRDRMEVINLSGYTGPEKLNIAKKYLVKRALKDTGLEGKGIEFSDDVLQDLIINYTREAGVRNLERVIRKLCSKAARTLVEKKESLVFFPETLDKHLGPRQIIDYDNSLEDQIGITNGLAWTPFGGEMLKVEAILMPGHGKIILTGQLGDVMKESARAAISYAKAHMTEFGIDPKKFIDYDLHIHLPAGAVPKDGPSGGITLLSSILSVLTNRPINAKFAMTGELNLRGKVMPIGGVKEKILAAKRNKIETVILPFQNKNDIAGQDDLLEGIKVFWAETAEQVIDQVLLPIGT